MRKLFGALLAVSIIGLVPAAHALSRYADNTPIPVSRAFTCYLYDVAYGERAFRSFEVEATRDTALHECFKKHNEIRQEANTKIRRI